MTEFLESSKYSPSSQRKCAFLVVGEVGNESPDSHHCRKGDEVKYKSEKSCYQPKICPKKHSDPLSPSPMSKQKASYVSSIEQDNLEKSSIKGVFPVTNDAVSQSTANSSDCSADTRVLARRIMEGVRQSQMQAAGFSLAAFQLHSIASICRQRVLCRGLQLLATSTDTSSQQLLGVTDLETTLGQCRVSQCDSDSRTEGSGSIELGNRRKHQNVAASEEKNSSVVAKKRHPDSFPPVCVVGPPRKRKSQRSPPDAFLSLRINSPSIVSSLSHIHAALERKDRDLQRLFVPLSKLHITLMVLRLGEDPERIDRAKQALKESCRRISLLLTEQESRAQPLLLSFTGLETYYGKVLFAPLDKENEAMNSRLAAIADVLKSTFSEAGIPSADTRPFHPHLTIAKVSRAKQKAMRGFRFSRELCEEFEGKLHGTKETGALELLSMTRRASVGAYYHMFTREKWTE